MLRWSEAKRAETNQSLKPSRRASGNSSWAEWPRTRSSPSRRHGAENGVAVGGDRRAGVEDAQPGRLRLHRQRMRVLALRILHPGQRTPPIVRRRLAGDIFGAVNRLRRRLRPVPGGGRVAPRPQRDDGIGEGGGQGCEKDGIGDPGGEVRWSHRRVPWRGRWGYVIRYEKGLASATGSRPGRGPRRWKATARIAPHCVPF